MGNQPQRLRDILTDEALLLTREEAATALRVGRTTVYALMKSGDLHAVHIGRSCRLPRAELQRYVDRLSAPGLRAAEREADRADIGLARLEAAPG